MKLYVVLALVLVATVQIIDGLASEPVPVPGPEPCAITQDALDELAQLRAIVTQLGTLVEKLTGQSRIPAEENRIRPPCPACTTEYDPVCGSNGETYSNMCMLIVAQCELVEVELDHEGACEESQTSPEANVERIIPPCPTCTAQYLPVCGTNGETYTNMCMLEVARCEGVEVEFDYNGPCTTEVDHLINPYLRATYNNATVTWVLPLGEVLEYIVTVISEEGEDSTKLPPLSTSFSTSVVKDQNYTIRITPVMSDGPGQEYDSGVFIPACPEFCTLLHEPVCGTDRKTYGNRCNLEVAMCNDEEGTLALANPGPCTTDENELRDAALEYTWREASLSWTAPVDEVVGYTAKVISEEGEDTTRLSALEISFTISVKPRQNYTIEITPIMGDGPGTTYSTGIFIPTCPQICTFEYDPLCATDGNTYSNPCAFEIAVCETGDETLMIDHQGTCDPCELIQCSPPLCEPPFVLGEAPLPGECCIGCVDKCESIACDVPQCEPGYLIGRVEGDCCDSCIRQVYADCSNASESGITTNGLYLIQPFGVAEPVEVTCDFENGGGKWTVILRRVPSDVDFLRSYNEYVAGFGDADGAYWIGLENLYQLNKHGNTKLFVSGTDHQGTSAGGHYNNFKVGTAEEDYALKIIAGYRAQANGNIGNALFYNKGAPFSAPDRDNDGAARNCASDLGGGFWYKGSICTRANPLGEFLTPSEFALEKGIFWATFRGKGKSLQFLEMKIRTA